MKIEKKNVDVQDKLKIDKKIIEKREQEQSSERKIYKEGRIV